MKTKNTFWKFVLSLAILLITVVASAQTYSDTSKYHIETKDGNVYTGTILSGDSSQVILNSDKLGEITLNQSDIIRIEKIADDKVKDGKYWFDNPQATRYFFSPNAYGLKAGEGYYQNVWVLINSFAVGLTDNISIGGGLVPLFLFGTGATPIWITPKVSFPVVKDKLNLGGGALMGTVLGEEGTGFGLVYGISTFGSKDKNISLGVGYGVADGGWAKSPLINVNLMIRTGPRAYFITENYFITTPNNTLLLISMGGRHIIKSSGLDYGLFIPFATGLDRFIAIPWLGITIPFGNKKKLIKF